MNPTLRLEEAAPGNGSLCGSTFLNRRFEKFLEDRLSLVPGWDRDTLVDAMQRFEWVAKRKFTGNAHDNIMIPVPGILDNRNVGVSRGRLRVTGDEMVRIFSPVLEDVHHLVKDQIRASKKKIKAIILVGGFGQSPYLRKYLRDSFSPDIELLTPDDGWTAVVRGALRKTLGDCTTSAAQTRIESRMARKNYGLICNTEFDESRHDTNKKYWSDFHGHWCIQVMSWFIKKGHRIEEATPIVTTWCQHRLVGDGPFTSIKVRLYELDAVRAPLYFNRRTKEHAILKPRLDRIQQVRIPICLGADNRTYYEISYEIHAFYYSAHCKYELWYEGKNHGSVEVEYV